MKSILRLLILALGGTALADDFPTPRNTEPTKGAPLPPMEAAAAIKLPPGFQATLFAAEPDVQQPIAMATDTRGRLWVVECYTYAESKVNFDTRLRDRILIFEDSDGDGRFDKRTVFWDKGERLTSVEPGFGGVFALCPPRLLFIPDKNADDVPDAEPEVLLDGFDADQVRHNVASGLRWGPDGWLYGRHGIQAYSRVGKPGAPDTERTKLSCCIWRFHPTRRAFEVVAQGTTNPWGLDWNEEGEAFFTNTVIGHLWHLIPGAHYRRMYGEDLNPHVYQLMEQCADHFHWDTGADWSKSRASLSGRVSPINDTLGGGHAHCGCLIYQGDQWPAEWRGKLLTINFHGRRINVDRLERKSSGYVGKHEADFAFFGDPWFRGVDLLQAPDGGIFVADWSDAGECHDNDGIHRTSGRIFKISYAPPTGIGSVKSDVGKQLPADVAKLRDDELVQLQLSTNEWLVRTARRVLQERAANGADMQRPRAELTKHFALASNVREKLRALWALNVAGGNVSLLSPDPAPRENDEVAIWRIRLTPSTDPSPSMLEPLKKLAQGDATAPIRLALASKVQSLPIEQRASIATSIASAPLADPTDTNLALMLWYALEACDQPAKSSTRPHLIDAALHSQIPLIRKLSARRLAEAIDSNPRDVDTLLQQMPDFPATAAADILSGLLVGFQGRRSAPKPMLWDTVVAKVNHGGDETVQRATRDLSVLFGDGRALNEVRAIALDGNADLPTRRAALQTLIESRAPDLRTICEKVIGTRELATTAARGLATFDDPGVGRLLVERFGGIWEHDRPDLISVLVSRPSFAKALLDAVAAGGIPRQSISAFHARQIRSLNDPVITQRLGQLWGEIRETDAARREMIARLKTQLSSVALGKTDQSAGRALFQQMCATCHRLYGEGGQLGPDLTGSARDNLTYLLENIVDPNAIIPVDAHVSVITLKDGRVLTGLIGATTESTVTVRGLTETRNVERREIARMEELAQSLMPEGLLDALDEKQVRDLMAYLMSRQQVPLPTP